MYWAYEAAKVDTDACMCARWDMHIPSKERGTDTRAWMHGCMAARGASKNERKNERNSLEHVLMRSLDTVVALSSDAVVAHTKLPCGWSWQADRACSAILQTYVVPRRMAFFVHSKRVTAGL